MLALFLILICQTSFANEIKVMTFNTMCDFCGSKKYDDFSDRIKQIESIVNKHSADLISLQEIRTGSQVNQIFSNLPQYKVLFTDSLLLSYADPAIAINTNKFEVLETGHFWLGPNNGSFSFGWKAALPRQAHWAKIQDKDTKQKLLFIGSHFDNRVENMIGSAKMINEFIQKSDAPVIFAADTNSTTDFEGYQRLVGNELSDSYDHFKNKRQVANTEHQNLCYHRKGDVFPDCRVDHILLSKNFKWKISNWFVDTQTFGKENRFPSDHRPIISTVQITND